jgi:hypothetical protein
MSESSLPPEKAKLELDATVRHTLSSAQVRVSRAALRRRTTTIFDTDPTDPVIRFDDDPTDPIRSSGVLQA